jgi:hypothetical protein
MQRASYRQAITWLASNDDCYWLGDHDAHGCILSVTASFVRDIWDVPEEKLLADLRRELKRVHPDHEALRRAK